MLNVDYVNYINYVWLYLEYNYSKQCRTIIWLYLGYVRLYQRLYLGYVGLYLGYGGYT
jgi:hypothetical protein